MIIYISIFISFVIRSPELTYFICLDLKILFTDIHHLLLVERGIVLKTKLDFQILNSKRRNGIRYY